MDRDKIEHTCSAIKCVQGELASVISFINIRVGNQPENFQAPKELIAVLDDTYSELENLLNDWDMYIMHSPDYIKEKE